MKAKAKTKRKKSAIPMARPQERWPQLTELCELTSMAPLVRKSYVLSRIWAWICRIQVEPQVRIPLPRVFTQRDP